MSIDSIENFLLILQVEFITPLRRRSGEFVNLLELKSILLFIVKLILGNSFTDNSFLWAYWLNKSFLSEFSNNPFFGDVPNKKEPYLFCEIYFGF